MEKKFDAIIVGGGPGGLSIGSMLAKEGVSSAIIEKEPTLGGRYRSVNFHGCRTDPGMRFAPDGMFASPEETYLNKLLSYLGLPTPAEYKIFDWTMGLVSTDNPNRIEYFSMDRKKGVENFFEFFAFGSGVPLEESPRKALRKAFNIMEDMSEEEMRSSVNVSFDSWIDKNVEDPMAQTILKVASPLMGAPATEVNYGQMANIFGAFQRLGAPLFGYPKHGNFEDLFVVPLINYYTDHGGNVFTNRRARSILIENGEAKGVAVQNNESRFLEEYGASVVICAIPIFEAVSRNILRSEFLTKEWAEAIQQCANLAVEDLCGFYFLRKEVFPEEVPIWVHVFDADYGIPTYVGDWGVGGLVDNTVVPSGKQLIYSYAPGGLDATHFGLASRMEKVGEANRRWKEAVDKAYPGFIESIEFEGLTLQLNWGNYAMAVVPTEIDMQSPNIRGLYFAGDTVWSVGSMVADKIYQMAFPLCERILKYIRRQG